MTRRTLSQQPARAMTALLVATAIAALSACGSGQAEASGKSSAGQSTTPSPSASPSTAAFDTTYAMAAKPRIIGEAARKRGIVASEVTQQVIALTQDFAFSDALVRSSDPRKFLAQTTKLMTGDCAREWTQQVTTFSEAAKRGKVSPRQFGAVYTFGFFDLAPVFIGKNGDGLAKSGPVFVNPEINKVTTKQMTDGRLAVHVEASTQMRLTSGNGHNGKWRFDRQTDFYMKQVGSRWLLDGFYGKFQQGKYPFSVKK